jgi:hypothetical protein
MTVEVLERGYRRAYREFYRWGSILRGALAKTDWKGTARHAAYAIGWKKCEPAWNLLIRARRVGRARPLLEHVLEGASANGRTDAMPSTDVGAAATARPAAG